MSERMAELTTEAGGYVGHLESCEWKGVVIPIRARGLGFPLYIKTVRILANTVTYWLVLLLLVYIIVFGLVATRNSYEIVAVSLICLCLALALAGTALLGVLDYTQWKLLLFNLQNIYAVILTSITGIGATVILYKNNAFINATYVSLCLLMPLMAVVFEIVDAPYTLYVVLIPPIIMGWSITLLKFYLTGIIGFVSNDVTLYKISESELAASDIGTQIIVLSITLFIAKMLYFYRVRQGHPVVINLKGDLARLEYSHYPIDDEMTRKSMLIKIFILHGLVFIIASMVLVVQHS